MNTRSVQRTLLGTSGLKSLSYGALTDIQGQYSTDALCALWCMCLDPGMRTGPEYQASIPDLDQGEHF